MKLNFSDEILDNNHELLVLEIPSPDLSSKGLDQFFLLDTLVYSSTGNNYQILDTAKLKPYSPKLFLKIN